MVSSVSSMVGSEYNQKLSTSSFIPAILGNFFLPSLYDMNRGWAILYCLVSLDLVAQQMPSDDCCLVSGISVLPHCLNVLNILGAKDVTHTRTEFLCWAQWLKPEILVLRRRWEIFISSRLAWMTE